MLRNAKDLPVSDQKNVVDRDFNLGIPGGASEPCLQQKKKISFDSELAMFEELLGATSESRLQQLRKKKSFESKIAKIEELLAATSEPWHEERKSSDSQEMHEGLLGATSDSQCLWHGGVQAVIEAPLERVWEISSDPYGLPIWMPMIEVCEKLQGDERKPGCTRRIFGEILPRIDGVQSWAIERLLEFDEENHFYTYGMDENNIGMEGYKATFQLNDYGQETTLITWFYEVEPMEDSCEEVMADFMSMFFKGCIRRLELLCGRNKRSSSSKNI